MVAQLEVLLVESADSPEQQWRSRILLRSAQEADHDIADRLYQYEKHLVEDQGHSQEARTVQAACMKLHRDFRRIHKALDAALMEYDRRQHADISQLGTSNNNDGAGGHPAQLLRTDQVQYE